MHLLFLDESGRLDQGGLFALGGVAVRDSDWPDLRDLEALRKRFALQSGQSGAIFAVGGRICMDYVSQPDAFESLYPKLLNGYLLDAIEWLDQKPAGSEELSAFCLATEAPRRSRRPSAGLGEDVRFRGHGIVGSGLELDGELVQLRVLERRRDFCELDRPSEPEVRLKPVVAVPLWLAVPVYVMYAALAIAALAVAVAITAMFVLGSGIVALIRGIRA
jgi:hypothetical protein